MKNRLIRYFQSEPDPFSNGVSADDLAKIVDSLNQAFWPDIQAEMDGDEAMIRCKNKTVWINTHCLVSGEAVSPTTTTPS
jgi:hypothetical protein